MAKDLGVLVIHGMGNQKEDFAGPLIGDINKKLTDADRDRIAWKPVYWADILGTRQSKYLDDARKDFDLDFIRMRRFIVSSIGDAAAYRKVDRPNGNSYELIHRRVAQATALLEEDLDRRDAPLFVLAHSLGCHIISNHIWDLKDASEGSLFSQFKTLKLLVTFGCNIPLFTFALSEVIPIDLPQHAIWENYFDSDDVLGFPLGPTRGYENSIVIDKEIKVGGPLTSWNPLSHNKYWTDDDLTIPIAHHIQEELRSIDASSSG